MGGGCLLGAGCLKVERAIENETAEGERGHLEVAVEEGVYLQYCTGNNFETLISGRLIEIRLCILPTSDMNLYAAIQIPGHNSRKDSHLDAVVIFFKKASFTSS